jgi:hypothetical protein
MIDGATLPSETYIIRPECLCYLEASEWSITKFLRDGKKLFQNDYYGYRELHSCISELGL